MPRPTQANPVLLQSSTPGDKVKWLLVFDARHCPKEHQIARFLKASDIDFGQNVEALYCSTTRLMYAGGIDYSTYQRRASRGKVTDRNQIVSYEGPSVAYSGNPGEGVAGLVYNLRNKYDQKIVQVNNLAFPAPSDIANLTAEYHARYNAMSKRTTTTGESSMSLPIIGEMMVIRRDISDVKCVTLKGGSAKCSYTARFETFPNGVMASVALAMADKVSTSRTSDTFYRSGGRWHSETLRAWNEKIAAQQARSGGGSYSTQDDGSERRSKCLANAWQDQVMAFCF